MGSLKIAGTSPDIRDMVTFVVGAGIYNPVAGTCCPPYITCYGSTGGQMVLSAFTVAVNGTQSQQFYLVQGDGSQQNYSSSASRSSGSTSVLTVQSGGLATGIASGSTNCGAMMANVPIYVAAFCGSNCPIGSQGASAPATVKPVINGLSPSQVGVDRSSVSMTISGAGFGSSPSVSIGGGVTNVSVQSGGSDKSVRVTFNAANASVGNANVTVTNGGQTSNPATLSIVCALPQNLTQTSWICAKTTGVLSFTYTWSSPTGNRADLATCTIAELVTYPNGGQPPSPPFPDWAFTNPTYLSGAATNALFTDTQSPPKGNFVKLYSQTTYTATQTYRYACGCSDNQMAPTPFPGFNGIPIARQVTDPSGTWIYQVTKSGQSCSLNLPQ